MMAAMSDWSTALERRINERTAQVTVVGMGYVGLSLAVELARAGLAVRGIDLDLERVNRLNRGESYLVDVPSAALGPLVAAGTLTATTTFDPAGAADVFVICVPTPLRKSKEPDISFILSALEHLLPHLRQGQLMVLESTTYPGTTEEVIQPRLESRGLVIGADAFFTSHSKQLAALAIHHAVPAVYQWREFAAAGGLMSYGSNVIDTHRLAGALVGRILKGDKPSDLPVQQATKVELYINLKTAKTLGITFPLTLLGRADEVFE